MPFLGLGYTKLWLQFASILSPLLALMKQITRLERHAWQWTKGSLCQEKLNPTNNQWHELRCRFFPTQDYRWNPSPGQHLYCSPVTDLEQRTHLSYAQNIDPHKLWNSKHASFEASKFVIICYRAMHNIISSFLMHTDIFKNEIMLYSFYTHLKI